MPKIPVEMFLSSCLSHKIWPKNWLSFTRFLRVGRQVHTQTRCVTRQRSALIGRVQVDGESWLAGVESSCAGIGWGRLETVEASSSWQRRHNWRGYIINWTRHWNREISSSWTEKVKQQLDKQSTFDHKKFFVVLFQFRDLLPGTLSCVLDAAKWGNIWNLHPAFSRLLFSKFSLRGSEFPYRTSDPGESGLFCAPTAAGMVAYSGSSSSSLFSGLYLPKVSSIGSSHSNLLVISQWKCCR